MTHREERWGRSRRWSRRWGRSRGRSFCRWRTPCSPHILTWLSPAHHLAISLYIPGEPPTAGAGTLCYVLPAAAWVHCFQERSKDRPLSWGTAQWPAGEKAYIGISLSLLSPFSLSIFGLLAVLSSDAASVSACTALGWRAWEAFLQS